MRTTITSAYGRATQTNTHMHGCGGLQTVVSWGIPRGWFTVRMRSSQTVVLHTHIHTPKLLGEKTIKFIYFRYTPTVTHSQEALENIKYQFEKQKASWSVGNHLHLFLYLWRLVIWKAILHQVTIWAHAWPVMWKFKTHIHFVLLPDKRRVQSQGR